MKKVFRREHLNNLTSYSMEVLEVVHETISVLDEAYEIDRDIVSDLGGFVIIAENKEDFKTIKKDNYIDLESDTIPEFVDLIKCENGQVFTNSLILLSSDFSISVVMPLEITPDNLKAYIIE